MGIILVVSIGFLLDLWWGDPHWLPHPVRLMGWLIHQLERLWRRALPATAWGLHIGGGLLVLSVLMVTIAVTAAVLTIAGLIHPWLQVAAEIVLSYQILATKSLCIESRAVYERLVAGDLLGARKAVSMIVGRDTQQLNEQQVAKAAIETVAENTSDGVIAPLFYLMLGGVPLAMAYKAVNTMDSMVGYRNDRYQYFGTCAARLDDLCNYLPARISALLMIAASWLLGMDWANGWRIYRRDRYQHASPNSAHTEAVCAGILHVQLAGDAYYFGQLHHKPYIGDDLQPVMPEHILQAHRLLYGTAWLALLGFGLLRWLLIGG